MSVKYKITFKILRRLTLSDLVCECAIMFEDSKICIIQKGIKILSPLLISSFAILTLVHAAVCQQCYEIYHFIRLAIRELNHVPLVSLLFNKRYIYIPPILLIIRGHKSIVLRIKWYKFDFIVSPKNLNFHSIYARMIILRVSREFTGEHVNAARNYPACGNEGRRRAIKSWNACR